MTFATSSVALGLERLDAGFFHSRWNRATRSDKGLLYAPDHGLLAYTVPNMAEYVHRHREDLD